MMARKMKIYLNSISYNNSLVDGPGIRTIIYLQGCDLQCKGCHNPSTWEIGSGRCIEVKVLVDDIKTNSINKKITISGGEPLLQKESLIQLIKELSGFDIALYTGHKKEDVPKEIFDNINYLKAGPFISEKKTTVKPYVGSTNQEFITVRHLNNETNDK